MEIASGFWGRIFTGAGAWRIRLTESHILMRGTFDAANEIDLADVRAIVLSQGDIWSTISIETQTSTLNCKGALRAKATEFQKLATQGIIQALHNKIRKIAPRAVPIFNLSGLYNGRRFLANRDVQLWLDSVLHHDDGVQSPDSSYPQQLADLLRHPLLQNERHRAGLESAALRVHDIVAGSRAGVKAHNGKYLSDEMERQKRFFDTIEGQPLTEEQRRAAIVLEDRNLVVAAAGSGKSSTVVAKIGHALTSSYCAPGEILALAFNSSAAEELAERIKRRLSDRLPGAEQVVARTFHKLGLEIIAQVESRKPDLAPWAAETRDNEGVIVEQLAAEQCASDPTFLLKWLMLRALASRANEEPRFASLEAYESRQNREADGRGDLRTLNGELVKSREELAIANWLFIKGVNYEYERSYEHDTADEQYRQYHPDFYYPDISCYHEHFALDANGKANPRFYGYIEGVHWKRQLHAKHETGLFETTSAMYRDDCLFEELEGQLRARGQAFAPRAPAEIEKRLSELKVPSFANFVRTFITHAKSNGLDPAALRAKIALQRDRLRARLFVDAVVPIMEAYEKKLRSIKCIDFEDMILMAASAVEAERYTHPYRLILVDEFQDISRCRARLVQNMLKQQPDCRLFAVGDDWQSIYRFAGAEQSIMLNFEKEFGTTSTGYLTQTFRSNQGIADVASSFVRKNPEQMQKRISAANARTASTIHVLEYERDEEVESLLEREIATLAEHARGRSAKIKVLLLGRYNYLSPGDLPKWRTAHADAVDLSFLTLHRSKGLEADYVFILGVNSGKYGFPSDQGDDPLLQLVLPTPEVFPHAEERRLFYVGITRAKHRCYILTKRGRSSTFIPELLTADDTVVYRIGSPQPIKVRAEACSSCDDGILREKSGAHGPFLGCSNYPRCAETKRLK